MLPIKLYFRKTDNYYSQTRKNSFRIVCPLKCLPSRQIIIETLSNVPNFVCNNFGFNRLQTLILWRKTNLFSLNSVHDQYDGKKYHPIGGG